MERLRWIDNNERPYILVNSAANILRLYEPDQTYQFKLVNKKSLSSSKLIQSRFNFIKIRLNGETTFGQIALSIYNPKKLISTIVSYNGSITKNKRINVNSTIKIKVPLRLNIIYLTCEIIKGKIINYKDIYQLDEKLELALYRDDALLALEAPAIYLPFN
jgi:murein L,D-transpeptidase YcbB/YkuD